LFNIPGHKGNAIQKHIKTLQHSCQNANNKNTNNKCWLGCGEKESHIHCWWECKLFKPLWKAECIPFTKLKVELLYNAGIPQPGIYPVGM
jgi:hypothetical protein